MLLCLAAALSYYRKRKTRDARYIAALKSVTTKIRAEYEVD